MSACLTPKTFLTAFLSKRVVCHLCYHIQAISLAIVSSRRENSLCGKWEVLLEIQAFDLQPGRCALVPRDECQICNGRLIFDEVARRALGEGRLQHAKNAFNLVVVPLDRAGNLLGVEFLEPRGLAEVRSV